MYKIFIFKQKTKFKLRKTDYMNTYSVELRASLVTKYVVMAQLKLYFT